jgi:flagellar motor switch/type III secretory pathway protein FliN
VGVRLSSEPRSLVRYRFDNLPSLSRNEVRLWNWYCRAAPSQQDWRAWVADIFGHLLEKPEGYQIRLIQTHLVDPKFGEKTLEFGSKQEISLGRQAENDVVLSATAIASKHARLFVKDGQFYLEDQGGQLGTYLWDGRLPAREKQLVRAGDQFTVFPYRFRILLETRWAPETDISLSDCTLQLSSRADYTQQAPRGYSVFAIDANPSSVRALVHVSPAFLEDLRQRAFFPLGLGIASAVPSDETFLGFVLFAILERLNRKLNFPMRFSFARDDRSGSPDNARGVSLSFAVRVGDSTGDFRVFLPFGFLNNGEAGITAAGAGTFTNLTWQLPVAAGFVDLSFDEISQLGLGDIIVAQHGPAILFPRNFSLGWSMTADGSNFTRFKIDKYLEGGLSLPNGADETASLTRSAVEALPVRLHVVLAEKEFTLAEIQSFSPGTVIELGASKTEPVRLLVNGKFLGEGELVDVEGSLAVRVLSWRNG